MNFNEQDFLCHYGILGMKWGVRRFENPDGTLTPAGKARYGKQDQTERAETSYGQIKRAVNSGEHNLDADKVMTNVFLSRTEHYDKLKKAMDLNKKANSYTSYAKAYELTGSGSKSKATNYRTEAAALEEERKKATNEYLSAVLGSKYNPKDTTNVAFNYIHYNGNDATVSMYVNAYFDQAVFNRSYKEIEKALSKSSGTQTQKHPKSFKPKKEQKAERAEKQRQHEESLKKSAPLLFKKYPQLYEDFGGPDKIDDWEMFELVVDEYRNGR